MLLLLVIWFLIVVFIANGLVLFFIVGLSPARILKNTSFYNSLAALSAVAISTYVLEWIFPLLSDLFRLADVVSGLVNYRFYCMSLYFLSALLLYVFSAYFLPNECGASAVQSSVLEWWLLAAHLFAAVVGFFCLPLL